MSLAAILDELELNAPAFARRCKRPRTQVRAWIVGRYPPSSKNAVAIIQALEKMGRSTTLAEVIEPPRRKRATRAARQRRGAA